MSAVPLTRARAWQLAWPMIFANAAVPLAGVVDTAVIGAVGGKADLGGVALGATVYNLFYWSFYFLRMGSTGLAAQASGAGDSPGLQRVLLRALSLAVGLGLVVLVLQRPIASAAFAVLQGGEAVEAAGAAYFLARVWGAPAAYAQFALSGWLIGTARTRAVLVTQVVFSVTNVVLDLWFVLGLGYGVIGVAAATAIADGLAALVAALYVWSAIREEGGFLPGAWSAALWHGGALRPLLAINLDMMVRSWALLAAFSWFANTGARHGAAILAGNHVLLQIVTVWAFVLDAYAFTTETAVGRAVGARDLKELRRAIRITTELALASGAAFLIVTLIAGPWVLERWIADPEARAAALRYLPYCATIPLIGVAAWQLDGVFIGAIRSAAMRNASVAATLLYLVADRGLTAAFGATGMWIAWVFFYFARAGTLAVAYPGIERAARAAAAEP